MISKKLALLVAVLLAGATFGVGHAEPASALGLPLCKSVREPRSTVFVPTSSGGSTSCLIGNGLVGCSDCAPIWTLQNSLNRCNGQNIKVDGYWGRQTRNALIAAQKLRKTTADGVYGPKTRDALRHARRNSSGHIGCTYL